MMMSLNTKGKKFKLRIKINHNRQVFFSPGTPVFPSPQKPTFPNSNSTRNQVDEEPLCGCATCKSLFILFICLFIYVYINVK